MSLAARKKAAVVDRSTLKLLGVPGEEGSVAVASIRHGFAELDFRKGPRLVALDFLPECAPGDVLELSARGRSVRIAVDAKATARAHARLLRLWDLVHPQSD